MSTKIHAICDALGNPTGFYLSEGQAHDLDGADALLPRLPSQTGQLIADRIYDADVRMRNVLEKAGIEAVIPFKSSRKEPREYDKEMYKSRHLIENFY